MWFKSFNIAKTIFLMIAILAPIGIIIGIGITLANMGPFL